MPAYANLYSGCDYVFMDFDDKTHPENIPTNIAALDAYFNQITINRATDSIVNLVMYPKAYYDSGAAIDLSHYKSIERPTKNGNYTPKNNKLLTYPYMFLSVESPNNQKIYRYEYFAEHIVNTKDILSFTLCACVTANPELACIPSYYKGSGSSLNFTEEIVLTGYPQLAFTIDSYRAWLAQTAGGSTALLSLLGSAGAIAAGVLTANPIAGVAGVMGATNTIMNNVQAATKGDTVKGSITGSVDTANRKFGFWFKQYGLRPEYAKMIDDYFTKYGYASRQLKVPNTHVRQNWTYTKTQRCTLHGNLPADDEKKICGIYDKGVTFWVNPYSVGDYSLSNRPLSEITP